MKTRLCEYADDLGETGDDQYYGCGFLSTASLAPLHSSASLSISPAEMTITSEINSFRLLPLAEVKNILFSSPMERLAWRNKIAQEEAIRFVFSPHLLEQEKQHSPY